VAESFFAAWNDIQRSGGAEPALRRAASVVADLRKRDSHFGSWVQTQWEIIVKPTRSPLDAREERRIIRRWLEYSLHQGGRRYVQDGSLKVPYTQFLEEHARKWGVSLLQEPLQLKSHWGHFQISATQKARQLISNSVGASRLLQKTLGCGRSEKVQSWLFLDRVDAPLGMVPEPLEDFASLRVDESSDETWLLFVQRDPLRDEAVISVGTWLPFEETKTWVEKIDQGRRHLLKLLPFLPAQSFRALPSLLELTELRGECVRRGQADRLRPLELALNRRQKLTQRFIRKKLRPSQMARRIFALSPYDLPERNRVASFEACLQFLDHFEERKRQAQSSLV
jgi:hypothetical protein